MSIIEVQDLCAYYMIGSAKNHKMVKAVDGINLSIQENEIYGIAGESGCGKTTLVKVLTGITKPPLYITGGSIQYHIDGKTISNLNQKGVRGRALSYIPQASMSVLNPVRRIHKTFEDFVYAHNNMSTKDFKELVEKHLQSLGLSPKILTAYPHQLSGGMQQRVTIALATILRPHLILADEPSTALDVIMQCNVIQLLKKIKADQQNTLLMITHDMAIHAHFAERIGIMYAGKLFEEAPTQDIFTKHCHPYTAFLIACLPQIGNKAYRSSTPGLPPSLIDPPKGCRFHPRCPQVMDVCRHTEPNMHQLNDTHRVACHLFNGTNKSSDKEPL